VLYLGLENRLLVDLTQDVLVLSGYIP
jgi:hypothetical protein